MKKAAIVTDAITVIGMIAISALMFSEIPGIIEDIQEIMSKESLRAQAVEIANLATLVSASATDIEIVHKLPEDSEYMVTIKDGYATVESGGGKASSKTISAYKRIRF